MACRGVEEFGDVDVEGGAVQVIHGAAASGDESLCHAGKDKGRDVGTVADQRKAALAGELLNLVELREAGCFQIEDGRFPAADCACVGVLNAMKERLI